VLLEDVRLEANEAGLEIQGQGLQAGSRDVTVTGTTGVPLIVEPNALTTLPEGGTFTGNGQDQVNVGPGFYTQTGRAPNLGVPYVLQGNLLLSGGASLDLTPGSVFVANVNSVIDVGWNSNTATLRAVGTAALPIVFRGLDPVRGSWAGFAIRGAVLSATTFDHVQIRHAGRANAGALDLAREISVTNTTITDSAGYAIRHPNAYATDYSTSNTLTGNTQGTILRY
jgi:hypothetical protein